MRLARRFRRVARSLDRRLAVRDRTGEPRPPGAHGPEIRRFLLSLDDSEEGRRYLGVHLARIVRTMSLVPPPRSGARALELGTYMQMAPVLRCVLGYGEVRGAYFGPLGRVETKASTINGEEVFRCLIDLFDAERDPFPYKDETFETVLACEIIEHLLLDPMHMLLEIRRVLEEGGSIVLTTPNAASYTSVANVLTQSANPQVYSQYPNPEAPDRETERPHVREYTPNEVREAVTSAGFAIETIFTDPNPKSGAGWVEPILKRNGYPTSFRGEQLYCIARKRADLPVTRHPPFLYALS